MRKRMIACISLFMAITIVLIVAIAYQMAAEEDDPVSDKEAGIILHFMNEDMANLRADNAFLAGNDLTFFHLEPANSSEEVDREWMEEDTLVNLDIDLISLRDASDNVTFLSNSENSDVIMGDLQNCGINTSDGDSASGYLYLGGRICMFSAAHTGSEDIILVKFLEEEDLILHNPLTEIHIELFDVIEGPVPEDIMDISREGSSLVRKDQNHHILIDDIHGRTIGVIRLSRE